MTGWMLHAVAAAAAFGAAGLLAERGLALVGRPARWLWLAVMAASVGWPVVAAVVPDAGVRASGGGIVFVLPDAVAGTAVPLPSTPADLLAAVPDLVALGVWCLASSALLLTVLLSAAALKRDRRRWWRDVVAGEPVVLSRRLGPAVVGVVRPRIVLPRWILEVDERFQRLIVLHEREHARAGDTRLVAAGLLALVLVPWCLPLWWQFHRLRQAIETDCDRRLLRTGAPARDYAHALLAVARRRRRVVLPAAAMAPSKAALKRRIRLITGGAPRGGGRLASALMVAAALLSLGVAAAPVPRPPPLAALTAPLRSQITGTQRPTYGPPLPDGSLPGDPGGERLAAEIRAHHAAAIAAGLPEESVIWFIVDRAGDVARTGIDRGTERAVVARLQARYPADTSEAYLAWAEVSVGSGEARVVWLLPEP